MLLTIGMYLAILTTAALVVVIIIIVVIIVVQLLVSFISRMLLAMSAAILAHRVHLG